MGEEESISLSGVGPGLHAVEHGPIEASAEGARHAA